MKTTEPAATIRHPEAVPHNAAGASPPGPLPFQRVLRDYQAQRSDKTAAPPEASLKRPPDAPPRAERHARDEPGKRPDESRPAEAAPDADPAADEPIHCAVSAECRDEERIHEDQETVDDVTGAAAQPAVVVAIAVPGPIADEVEIVLTEEAELAPIEDAQVGSAKSGIATEIPNLDLPTADLAGFVPAAGEPSDRSGTSAADFPAATTGRVTVPDGPTPAIAPIGPPAPSDQESLADDPAAAVEGMPETASAVATDWQSPSSPDEAAPAGNEQPIADGLAIDAAETPAPQGTEPRESAPGPVTANVTTGEPPAVRGAPFPTGSAREREGSRAADPIELDPVRLLHRVGRALHIAEQRGRELTLRLSPPELGSLRLELRVEGGVMTARLEAETQIARTALIENLPALRERLAEQGIRIERFEVDLMQQRGQEPGARDHGPEWESGRGGVWESARTPKPHVEISPPLTPSSPTPLNDTANTLNVID